MKLLLAQYLAIGCVSQAFDFFYFVQQRSGLPHVGGPPINNNDGSYPSNCDPDSPFDRSEISDLISRMQTSWPSLACPSSDGTGFWSHEWEKHGTCSESVLDQYGYFEAALNLKKKVDLLQILGSEGIQPNGGFYNLSSIHSATHKAIGYDPWIKCKTDASGNSQLYQIYLCVGRYELTFTECPVLPRTTEDCASAIKFPAF
ncbi:hypothetical protein I3842_05G131500 [Carya illinoinensis]|uniref:Uncharacterized protein n=1 Tax=Carya illinoinensis TaxID=32201 RepID=A0A922EZ44_CARIL|nr:hypothetical protein I3842_05G131500 [Carya illinoinensis]